MNIIYFLKLNLRRALGVNIVVKIRANSVV